VNKNKVIETLKRLPPERWYRGRYISGKNYCALGWLTHKAGMTDEELEQIATFSSPDKLGKMNVRLIEAYDMYYSEAFKIVHINDLTDSFDDMVERVSRL
jgi:hypothetical protein